MGYLNRFIDAGNTREKRVCSIFVAFILALSFAGMPLFGERAQAAQASDAQNPMPAAVPAAAPRAAAADGAEAAIAEQPDAPAPLAVPETAEASTSAVVLCDHSAWSASDSRWVVEEAIYPTCTQPGIRTKACPLCGQVVSEEEIAPLGHNFEAMICVDDTEYGYCEDGCDSHKHRIICESCDGEEAGGTLYEDHVYGDWEIVREAAPGDSGLQQRMCIECGHVQSAPVADLMDPELPAEPEASDAEPAPVTPAAPATSVTPATPVVSDIPAAAEAPADLAADSTATETAAIPATDPAAPVEPAAAPAETIEDDANPLAAQPDQGVPDAPAASLHLIDGLNGLLQQLAAIPNHLMAFARDAAGLLHATCGAPDAPAATPSVAPAPDEQGDFPCDRQLLTLQ